MGGFEPMRRAGPRGGAILVSSSMNLVTYLHAQPAWLVYAIIVPGLVASVVVSSFAGRHLFRVKPRDERSRGALEAFKSIVASLAFLLAFLLVQAQGNLVGIEKLVAQEASLLNTLDRTLLRFGNDDLAALRPTVRELALTVVEDEWPQLGAGERSAKAESLLNTLSRRIRTTNATTMRQQSLFSEMVAQLDGFSDRREELIAAATTPLPGLFWNTVGGLVVVLCGLALFVTPNPERILTMVGVITAAGLVMALVLITEAPFAGEPEIDPAPLLRVVKAMEIRVP